MVACAFSRSKSFILLFAPAPDLLAALPVLLLPSDIDHRSSKLPADAGFDCVPALAEVVPKTFPVAGLELIPPKDGDIGVLDTPYAGGLP